MSEILNTGDTQLNDVSLLPTPADLAKQMAAEMSQKWLDFLKKLSEMLNPSDGESKMIHCFGDKYQFPGSSLKNEYETLSYEERKKVLEFVKLSGWTHLYIKVIDVDGRELQRVLMIEKRRTLREYFADILK